MSSSGVGTKRAILDAKDIDCETDTVAVTQAKQLVDGHDIEVWKQGEFLAWFPTKDR